MAAVTSSVYFYVPNLIGESIPNCRALKHRCHLVLKLKASNKEWKQATMYLPLGIGTKKSLKTTNHPLACNLSALTCYAMHRGRYIPLTGLFPLLGYLRLVLIVLSWLLFERVYWFIPLYSLQMCLDSKTERGWTREFVTYGGGGL